MTGFLAVVGTLSKPFPPPSSVSNLYLLLSLPVWRRSNLLTVEGRGRGWARSQITRRRESLHLALHKLFNTLWSLPSAFFSVHVMQ